MDSCMHRVKRSECNSWAWEQDPRTPRQTSEQGSCSWGMDSVEDIMAGVLGCGLRWRKSRKDRQLGRGMGAQRMVSTGRLPPTSYYELRLIGWAELGTP